jgi:hypothetical protein
MCLSSTDYDEDSKGLSGYICIMIFVEFKTCEYAYNK